jgi:hypothetical protein
MYDGRASPLSGLHNEETLVASTVGAIPDLVDRIFVVDDGSADAAAERAAEADSLVELVAHERNRAVRRRHHHGLPAGSVFGPIETSLRLVGNPLPIATIVLVTLLVVSGLDLLLFAVWFDMESNKDLR